MSIRGVSSGGGGNSGSGTTLLTSRLLKLAGIEGISPAYNGVPTAVPIVASLTPVSVNSTATSIEQTVTITGLVAGDIITNVTFGGTQTSGITLVGWRLVNAAAGTVGLMFKCTGGPLVPAAGNYTFSVARMTGGTSLPHVTVTGTGSNTAALTSTTLTGTVQSFLPTSPKIRQCGRLTDWNTKNAAYLGFYGPWNTTTTTTGNAGQSGSVMRFDFVTDATKIEMIFNGTPTGTTYPTSFCFFRVLVDGKIVTPDSIPFPGNSKAYRALIDFTQAGAATPANTPRRIRIEASSSATIQIGSIVIGITDSMWYPAADTSIRAIVFGDSFTEGYLLPQQYTGYANTLGYMLGWDDLIISGVGGTGYLKPGTAMKWRDRINDLIAPAPDVIVILGSINDAIGSAYTAAQVQAEATLFYQQLTTALPNTPIFVAGVQVMQPGRAASSALNQLALDQNTALKTVIAGFPTCRWIEMNDPSDLWFTGSSTVAAPVGDGNADRFVLVDGTHPPQVGHDYLARRLYDAIKALVKSQT